MKLPPYRNDPVWMRLREHDVMELWDDSIAPHVASTYQARISLLRGHVARVTPSGGRVLDVGAAQGTLGLLLAEEGFRVTLLDLRPQCMDYARARYERGQVEFISGALSAVCPPLGDYDTVVCTELLEHVPRPSELLIALRDKLRFGGALLLTTPNADYWFSRLPGYGTASQGIIDSAEPNSMDGDAHRYLLTQQELIALTRGVGLRVAYHRFFSPCWLEGHLKTRFLHRLAYRMLGRILRPSPSPSGLIGKRLCAAQLLIAAKSAQPNT